ncbi:MAG TPA: DUF3375 family protein [Amycolatopsis sp.]|uniref:DUF3375 family protein n=1 Tax=Amycolatopsis sp. TaxID=37632 RepID=UPI002B469049|nr:DUF3375 family protein [Amycolatopsis sp.]HKS48909.1 DUF3375 family protein [Amycolatopsis sp.]
MDFDELDLLRRGDPAWKLPRADNAPLVLSFLSKVFVEDNIRAISAAELISRLDDERLSEGTFPKPARAYREDWPTPANGWLRKYYPPGSDRQQAQTTGSTQVWLAKVQVSASAARGRSTTWVRRSRPASPGLAGLRAWRTGVGHVSAE